MDDREAIERCRAGDREAFRVLVTRYEREAMGHALAILLSRAEAEDALQEAFLDAWRALGRFDASRRFYPWFYVILRNRCLKRAGRRGPETVPADESIVAPGTPADRDLAEALDRALRGLSPKDREAVTLHHLDGLSCAEVAERLAVPAGTVMSRLFAAREKLREALTADFPEVLR